MTRMATKKDVASNGETGIVPAGPATWNACHSLAEAIQIAELVAKSAALPDVRNAGQALLKILAGAELGFSPFSSLTGVHIIEGKPAVGAHLQAAAIKRSGRYDYRIVRLDAEACELEFTEEGKAVGRTSLSMEEAKRQGFALDRGGALKANYRRHPADMLFARCITMGYRRYCPDITGGMPVYDPDELTPAYEPVPLKPAEPGDVVDAEYEVAMAEPVASPEPPAAAAVDSPLMASQEQLDTFSAYCQELALPPEAVRAGLAQYRATNPVDLTAAQLTEVNEKLRLKALAKNPPAPPG